MIEAFDMTWEIGNSECDYIVPFEGSISFHNLKKEFSRLLIQTVTFDEGGRNFRLR